MLSDACSNLLTHLTEGFEDFEPVDDFKSALNHYSSADCPIQYAPSIFPALRSAAELFQNGRITAVALAIICLEAIRYYDNLPDFPIEGLIDRIQEYFPEEEEEG